MKIPVNPAGLASKFALKGMFDVDVYDPIATRSAGGGSIKTYASTPSRTIQCAVIREVVPTRDAEKEGQGSIVEEKRIDFGCELDAVLIADSRLKIRGETYYVNQVTRGDELLPYLPVRATQRT